jgi:hypothetical protein
VTLTKVPVIAEACSEARNAAVAATSASRGDWRSILIRSRWPSSPSNAAASSCRFLLTEASFSGDSVSGTCAEEVRGDAGGDRTQEVGRGHLDQRGALHVAVADEVEGAVDAARGGDHRADMLVPSR